MIRPFEEKDAIKASRLISETILNINSKDYSEVVIKNILSVFSPKGLLQKSKKRKYYVFEENNEILGVGSIQENRFYSIFVKHNLVGKGLGKQIVTFLEERAREDKFDFVELTSSLTSVNFYKKLGYNEIGKIEDSTYGDTILMRKSL